MMQKPATEDRIENLTDIKECVMEAYIDEPGFAADLRDLIVWISKRTFEIKRA